MNIVFESDEMILAAVVSIIMWIVKLFYNTKFTWAAFISVIYTYSSDTWLALFFLLSPVCEQPY